eukprot:TRINITY_DN7559_c0_g1_i1.p1 TRINITY_DN7559_c0_g1~~TRINITY_DN7559_c0_g1_i1.p1  ORF type:complete len:118 (-),score=13.65 TRINITY_DN7559_c0_g1_i1:150-503(-)
MQYQGTIQTTYVEDVEESLVVNATDTSYAYNYSLQKILEFCDQNYSLVFTGSFGYMEQSLEASKNSRCRKEKNPTHIVSATGTKTDDYLSWMFAKVFQAKYLAGMTAGYCWRGTKIG